MGLNTTASVQELKRHVASDPSSQYPSSTPLYRLETDASDYALGAVLSQKQDDKWHPVAFLSKSLNEAERNYEIYDKRMLAIMVALDEWHHHLLGCQITIRNMDRPQNLTYFKKPQKMNRRQARWITELQEL